MSHVVYIVFLFALGSCVGSFLNVVVWRLPRIKPIENEGLFHGFYRSLVALSDPPSHCPKCNHLLPWYDNIPVIGWFKLGGRCRFCKQAFSIRYAIVEAITGLIFVGYYVAFFMFQIGPCVGIFDGHVQYRQLFLTDQWPIYALDMFLLSGLLAASLIDAELFLIPMEIPWLIAVVAVAGHTAFDTTVLAGNVMVGPIPAAMALGATLGVMVSLVLLSKGIFAVSFAEGAPLLEVHREEQDRQRAAGKSGDPDADADAPAPREWSAAEVRHEIRKEMLFLLPPMFLGLLFSLAVWKIEPLGRLWAHAAAERWAGALLGSLLGGLVGAFVVWLTRILGSLAFGREAMGMGDVDLMAGVGAMLGAGPAVVAFFIAPFFGIALAVYMLLTGKKRELPYGPYLSLASACVILFYGPIAEYFVPGLSNLAWLARSLVGGG